MTTLHEQPTDALGTEPMPETSQGGYKDLQQIKDEWVPGNFTYPDEIVVAGVTYKYRSASPTSMERAIIKHKPAFMVYHTPETSKEKAKAAGMRQWIVFIWGATRASHIKPYDIRTITAARGNALGMGTSLQEQQERIGDVVLLKIFLPSGTGALKGKVDTGAEISSLHADQMQMTNGMVKFINREISDNVISVPMAEKQAVSSADGGMEYRPVVELDIEINGKPIRRVKFNLNNRDQMEYQALVGQNVLEKTNFLVDPKMDGIKTEDIDDDTWLSDEEEEALEVDYEALEEYFKDVQPVIIESQETIDKAKTLYNILQESDITFEDLFRVIRTQSREIVENLEY